MTKRRRLKYAIKQKEKGGQAVRQKAGTVPSGECSRREKKVRKAVAVPQGW